MKVYTTTPVLKKAWVLLNELNLSSLLNLNRKRILTFQYGELLNSLITDEKLDEFCSIITQEEQSKFFEMEFPEKKELISDFFSVLGDPFKPFMKAIRNYLDRIVDTLTRIASQNIGQKET